VLDRVTNGLGGMPAFPPRSASSRSPTWRPTSHPPPAAESAPIPCGSEPQGMPEVEIASALDSTS